MNVAYQKSLTFCNIGLFVLLLSACGRPAKYTPSPELIQQRSDYLEWVKPLQGIHGFISLHHCDALLDSTLLAVGGAQVDVTSARKDTGRWLRRPQELPECKDSEMASTSIASEHILGVMTWAVWNNRLDVLNALWLYGQEHVWKMGTSEFTIDAKLKSFLHPNLIGTLGESIYAMGGYDHPERLTRLRINTPKDGSRRHTDMLDILLRDKLGLDRSTSDIVMVEINRRELKDNPLAQILAGRYVEAERLLLRFHPSDRLPNSEETCSPLAWINDNLESCPGVAESVVPAHFLFLSTILMQEYIKDIGS